MFRGFNLNDLETSGDEATTSSQTSASDDLRRFHENIVKAAEKANYEVALRHVNEALLSFPNKLWLQLHKAYFLVLTYKADEANETLMEILKNDPLNATAIAILAILFYYQGNLRKSVEVLHNVQEADSETLINTYKRKAQKLIKILDSIPDVESPKEKFTDAVMRMIADGLKVDPTNREVTKVLRIHQGIANYKNQRFQLAIADFTQALKLDNANLQLFLLRAKCYKTLVMHDDVIIDLMEAETLNKTSCQKISSEIREMRKSVGAVYIPKTNYNFLEVPHTATDNEIIRSYNSLSLLHRVNLNKAATEAEKRKLDFKYKRVENAFRILNDKRLKMNYDKLLEQQESSIECLTVRVCLENIARSYQCCCTGVGSCVGQACTGLGHCMSVTCCSETGLRIICKYLNCGNIIIAFAIFLIMTSIFYFCFLK